MEPVALPDAWRQWLRAQLDRPPLRPRLPLRLPDGAEIGSVETTLAERLLRAGLPLRRPGDGESGDCIVVDHGHGDLDAALDVIARWLHEQGQASRWRDELLAVRDEQLQVRAAIERAAVRPLGIATLAVHLVGRRSDGHWWLQQRAFDKATDPGRWDTLMGGLSSADESIHRTLERETWEEAGLKLGELKALRHLTPKAPLIVRRPLAEGYMIEHIEVFVADVPDGLAPVNQDGEVECFDCLDTAALCQRLLEDAFTLEAALIFDHVLGHVPGHADFHP
jgi:8-oxo-dGTP pyrophosphatase MutT (NUDIX family)